MNDRRTARVDRRRRRRATRRANRRIAASRTLNRILRMTLGAWLHRLYRPEPENTEVLKGLRPPYLVLPNHGSVWDPFMVNRFVPGSIHYVVSDANFRSKIVEFGLGLVGSIRKTKVMSDLDTVKNIMKIRDRGGVIGIFPEGQNTWDGHTMPIFSSTARLAKMLKIPVVTARLAGAFLCKPRWSRSRRRGSVRIRFDLAFTPEQLARSSVEEIDRRIVELLDHDEFEHNRTQRQPFIGRNRAEYIEIALFICPACRAYSTVRSRGHEVECLECGYRVFYDRFGFFRARSGELRFDNLHEWNRWQVGELYRRLESFAGETDGCALFTEAHVRVRTGYKSLPLREYCSGRLELHPDRVLLVPEGRPDDAESFLLRDIQGINVQNNEHLEFYRSDVLYRITVLDRRRCTYKWDMAVRRLQEMAMQASPAATPAGVRAGK